MGALLRRQSNRGPASVGFQPGAVCLLERSSEKRERGSTSRKKPSAGESLFLDEHDVKRKS